MTTTSDEGTSATTDPATSEPITSTTATTEPATTEPATTGTTSETGETDTGMDGCGLHMAGDQTRHVHDIDNGETKLGCDSLTDIFYGYLDVKDGNLLMGPDEWCDGEGETPEVYIGKGWPTKMQVQHECVKTTVYWHEVGAECRIAGLTIASWDPVNPVDNLPLFMAELSPPADLPLTLSPVPHQTVPCGCANDMLPCCMPNDAGDYTLGFDGTNVGSGVDSFIMKAPAKFHFWNIQSYVGPGCQDEPPTDIHFDWFAERVF